MDTFICGTCQGAFNEIELFMRHKQDGCESQQPEVIQVHVNGAGEITEYTDGSGDGTATLNLFSDTLDQAISVHGTEDDGATPTLIILNEGQSLVTPVVIDKSTSTPGLETQDTLPTPYITDCSCRKPGPPPQKTARRKGRPKKGEEKTIVIDAVSKEVGKPPLPDKSKDGKYHCVRCKRAFAKERFFNTHKCLGASDYVVISNKDVKMDSGEESDEADAGAQETEEAEEYSAPSDLVIADDRRPMKLEDVVVSADPDGDAYSSNTDRPTDDIDDIPVFRTVEEKLAFEANLNVDLSNIDHMFKIHVIEQDLNENASIMRSLSTSLSLYSCSICEKVFKTLSHMRLHCLIHTDLKPFKCFKCSYTSNSKGNLYTHMRKHTGQFYNCNSCEFKTVNKSHLLEHEATHSSVRRQCEMCKKDYNTLKSLINHVRKYHKYSTKGREYLQSFLQGRQTRGTTVIHQCHVCNRKFKKKIDRDRHLFIHDIKDIPNIQHCQLCDYTASRRTYLEKHYLKHRVIYCCSLCDDKFLSTVRLIDHLTSAHLKDDPNQWESLFEESINNSLYLPEPDENFAQVEKEFVNLPEELSSSSLKKILVESVDKQESESDTKDGVGQSETSALHPPESLLNSCVTQQGDKDMLLQFSSALQPDGDSGAELEVSVAVPDTGGGEDSGLGTTPMDTEESGRSVNEGMEMLDKEATPSEEAALSSTETDDKDITSIVIPEDQEIGEHLMDSEDQSPVTDPDQPGEPPAPAPEEDVQEEHDDMETSTDLGEQTEGLKANDPETMNQGGPMDQEQDAGVEEDPGVASLEVDAGDDDAGLQLGDSGACKVEDEIEEPTGLDEDAGEGEVPVEGGEGEVPVEGGEGEVPVEGGEGEVPVEGGEGEVPVGEGEPGEGDEVPREDEDPKEGEMSGVEKERTIVGVVKRLGYREMSMEIFHKMRETFGGEECEYCGKLFYNKADYESHIRTHTGDKPFNCENCNFRAISKDMLKRHIEKEHLKVTFSCKDCDFVASSRTTLWNHQIKHLGVTGIECNECKENFETIKRLRNHMMLVHPEADRSYLDSVASLKHRMQGKMGRRSYKCPYCDRVFIRANSELQKHIWVHEGIKPYKCPVCPHACRSKTNLRAHMLRHSSEKPFQCSECGKAYKSKTALRWHVRSHRDGKFKCEKCPYEATQHSHLKRHMETHDIVKKYVCQHCNYSANTPGYMKIHYTRNHKGLTFVEKTITETEQMLLVDGKVYKCLSCDYLFGNLSDLKRHLRVRHHVQVQDISMMDQMQVSEVQVLQCDEDTLATDQTEQTVQTATADAVQINPEDGGQSELDEKTASAVSLLQQIIDMSQQGAFGQQQHITVQDENGQMVAVNPETIIVQQDGEGVLVTDGSEGAEGGQYVIQYVSPEMHLEGMPLEIQTLEEQPS